MSNRRETSQYVFDDERINAIREVAGSGAFGEMKVQILPKEKQIVDFKGKVLPIQPGLKKIEISHELGDRRVAFWSSVKTTEEARKAKNGGEKVVSVKGEFILLSVAKRPLPRNLNHH